jgi:hypothetical protein
MDDSKALQAILDKLSGLEEGQKQTNSRLNMMDGKLSGLDEKVTALQENSEITRNGVNTLLDWAEKVEVQISIPLFPKERD